MLNIMNINNIDFEEFKKYYQYLIYIKCNIGKYILTDKDFVNFMTEQHKIYPNVKVNQNKLYYQSLMDDIIQRFKKYEKDTQKLFIKLNLTIDTQITFQKICNYEKELKTLKEKISQLENSVKNKDIDFVKIGKKRCNFLKDTIIGNGINILIPITYSNEQKKQYLKEHHLKYRLIHNLQELLNVNINSVRLLLKRKKFFNYFNKHFCSKEEYILKKNKLKSIFIECEKIRNFLNQYNYKSYLCPVCPYKADNEMNLHMHLFNNHKHIENNMDFNKSFKLPSGYNHNECLYCMKKFKNETNNEILKHFKIYHMFKNVSSIDFPFHFIEKEITHKVSLKRSLINNCQQSLFGYSTKNTTEKKNIQFVHLNKRFKKNETDMRFTFVDKLKHDYPKLFKIPNPYLDEQDLKNECRELFDENNNPHYVIDGILKFSEQLLFKKLYKIIKKLLGKNSFKEVSIQKNFGYKYGLMTIENEVISLLAYVKNDVFKLLSNNIYEHSLSKYSLIIKEFENSLTNLTKFSQRFFKPIYQIQNILNECTKDDDFKSYEERFEICYKNLNTDVKKMTEMLDFLFNFMTKITTMDGKNKNYMKNLIEDMIMPDKKVNMKLVDKYDENQEEIETKAFSLLLSYLDKSEHAYISEDVFEKTLGSDIVNPHVEKPYIWSWECSYQNESEKIAEFYKDFKIIPQNIKEYKEEFINYFSSIQKNFENPDNYTTDFNYLIDTFSKIKIKSNKNTYTKVQNILHFLNKINNNKIIKNVEYETLYAFSNTRLKYFDENELKLVNIKESEIDSHSSKLLRMRKMILHQNIRLIIIMSMIKNFLIKLPFDNDDKEEKYRVISLSVFFKRYFQTLSVEVNKQIFNNPVPIFKVQRKNYFSLFTNQTNESNESNGFDCFADNSDSDSNTDDDYPQYNDYQDIIDNHEENNGDYNENEVDWEGDLATEGNMDNNIRDSYE